MTTLDQLIKCAELERTNDETYRQRLTRANIPLDLKHALSLVIAMRFPLSLIKDTLLKAGFSV